MSRNDGKCNYKIIYIIVIIIFTRQNRLRHRLNSLVRGRDPSYKYQPVGDMRRRRARKYRHNTCKRPSCLKNCDNARLGFIYLLRISKRVPDFQARCQKYGKTDFTNDPRGWIIVMQRSNEQVNFQRPMCDYVKGFGNHKQDYWLGLDLLHKVRSRDSLRFIIECLVLISFKMAAIR